MRLINLTVLLAASVCAAVIIPILHAPSAGEIESRDEMRERTGGLPFMSGYYYAMRTQGNPGIDVDARLMQAWSEVSARERLEMRKSSDASDVVWTERGPWNIGGRVRSLAVDPSNPSVLYAGSASGGVWKSTNAGGSWMPLTDTTTLTLGIGAIALDPNNSSRIFAGIGEPLDQGGRVNASFVVSACKGILKSEDGGVNWSYILCPAATGGIHRIAVNPVSADTLLMASRSGLFKTTNGGASWVKALNGTVTDVTYKPGDPSTVYAAIGPNGGGSGNGVYISTAGGDRFTFTRAGVNFPSADSVGRITMTVTPADPQRIYCAVALNGSKQANRLRDFLLVMLSRNGGQTWERKINAITASVTNGQAWYDLEISASPTKADVVFVGGIYLYRSTNGGQGFVQVSNGTNVHADMHAVIYKPGEPSTVIAGGDGGVFMSTDLGSTWTAKYSNLGTIQYYACTYDPTTPSKIYGGTQDNGSQASFNGQNTGWASLFGGDGGNTAIDPKNSNNKYFTSASVDANGNIYRPIYRTGIGSPLKLEDGLNGGTSGDRFTWVPALMFHPINQTHLFTATQFVYRMKAPGGTLPSWDVISPDLDPSGGVVADFDISHTDGEVMNAVTSRGKAWMCRNLSAIEPTWVNISAGLPASKWISDVMVDYSDPNTAFVAVSGYGNGHVFMTTNGGTNWTNLSGDLPDIPAGAVVRSRLDPNVLFVATDLGVWYTTNLGAHWDRYGSNLPNVVVYDMKLTPDNTLVAGTYGRGMWVTSAILAVDQPVAPGSFSVGQNYPNPFNPSTTIPVTLGSVSDVRVDIFSASGTRLRTLRNEKLTPGRYNIPFDASGLPGGVYLCSVTVNGQRSLRKMLLLK